MQLDFHFYAIYALVRAAGFEPDDAHIVAYSSQYTDDAKYEHALEFENGGRFQQVLSAHKLFDPEALLKATCYRIWLPFHFLPGNLGADFYERILTKANSVVAQRMLEEFLGSALKPYSLHRLGIILHVYVDTWSHQNFMGLEHDMNDVESVKGYTKTFLKEFTQKALGYWAPKLGHAQAGTLPDEPYRKWEYKNYKGERVPVLNHERALDAVQNCYMVLSRFLNRFSQFSVLPVIPWQNILGKVAELFSQKGELEDRNKAWREAISKGTIEFEPQGKDVNLVYDDREWFKAAVTVIVKKEPGEKDRYQRNEGFERSNWKYFHDAATSHRFHVLHELLPEYGIICD